MPKRLAYVSTVSPKFPISTSMTPTRFYPMSFKFPENLKSCHEETVVPPPALRLGVYLHREGSKNQNYARHKFYERW